MATVKVEYVGLKPSETDHLYGTGLTWQGLGDVQEVPAEAWAKMEKHTDVWRIVIEKELPTESWQVQGTVAPEITAEDLAGMPDADIRAQGKARGYALHQRLNRDNLIAAFLAAQAGT